MTKFLPIIMQIVGIVLAAIAGGSFSNLQQPGVDTEVWKYLLTALMGVGGVTAVGGGTLVQARKAGVAKLPDACDTTVTLFDQAIKARDTTLLQQAHDSAKHLITAGAPAKPAEVKS